MKWEIIALIYGCVSFSILLGFAMFCLYMFLDALYSDEDS